MHEQMMTMMENLNGGLSAITIDKSGAAKVIYANNHYYSLLGYTREQFHTELASAFDVIHPQDAEETRRAVASAMESRTSATFEYRCYKRDGEMVYLRCNASVVALRGVGDTVLLCIITDISAQRIAEQKERRVVDQLRAIMASIDAGVSAVTLDGGAIHYVYANDYYYSMLGYTREQFLKEKPGVAFEIVHPDDRKATADAALIAQRTGEPFQIEYRVLRRDGTWFWIRCNGSSCRVDGFDQPLQIAVTRDITKEKEAESQTLSAYEQLQFLNDTAHDLLAQPDAAAGTEVVLKKVRDYFRADRAYVFEMDDHKEILCNTYEVCADGVSSEMANLQDLPYDTVPFWWPALYDNRYISIEDVDALGEGREEEKRILKEQNIQSLIAVPINREGKPIGFIGVDNPRAQQTRVEQLKAIGDYIAITLTRRDLSAKIESNHTMLRELMNDTPGGFVRIQLRPDGVAVPVYVNEGFLKLTGMTREAFFEHYEENAMQGVHPDDMEIVKAAQNEMISTGETHSAIFRLRHGNGDYIRLMIFGRMTHGGSGEVFFNIYYTDATLSEQEKRELSFQEMLPIALKVMMDESNDLSFVKDNDLVYICCSSKFAEMVGLESAEAVAGKTDYDLFDRALADRYRADDLSLIESGQSLVDQVEHIPAQDGIARYSTTSKYLLRGSTGNILGLYGVGRDITEEREVYSRLKLLVGSIPGGIASYISTPESLRITYFNDGFCQIMGYSREEYEKISAVDATSLVFDEDISVVMEQLEALRREERPIDCDFRIHSRDEGYRWVNLKGNIAERSGDICVLNAVLFDITSQKAVLDAERIHEEEMQAAMSHLGKMVCEFDPVARTLNIPQASATRYNVPSVLHDFPASLLSRDVIDEAYAASFTAFFEAIQRGEKTGFVEYREKWADGSAHWARAEFSTIFTADGKPTKAIVAVEDTTQQHARFELEQSRPALGEENLIVHALFNLTTGETIKYAYRDGGEVPFHDRTALGYGDEKLDRILINAMERAQYRELNDRNKLLARFERGETELSLDYRRLLPDGDTIWVRNLLHMVRQPGGNDVLLFEYFYNIEEEKTMELLSRSLVSVRYDYVARVNGQTGRFSVITNTGVQYGMPPKSGDDFDQAVVEIAEKFIHPQDRELMIQNICVDGIKKNLEEQDSFSFTCRLIRPNGEIRYKKLTEYYLDVERSIYIIIREDISQVVEGEMRKNMQLSDALAAAQQASKAKSQFLSRMSHELRTPMNAIIGLSTISATEIENPLAMADAIGKIGMSARFLLSLINDILEMSRIESGRMTLNEAPFDFERFIAQVNTIVFAQAEMNGVDYDAIVGSYTEPVYVGDATKLQEILVNVLGNAVKFTPSGGKVTLTIEQIRLAKQAATLRFTISDTGIGIDEAFIPHLFDPFSQEASHYTAASTGTGLGLAITKNLVEMMNGHISVKSIKNVGSVFTIDVQLGVSQESRRYLDITSAMNLEQMRALVVDDDVTVCKSTEGILKMMGIDAQWATSGRQAVELVKSCHKSGRDFDTVFIDWKMPEMDGIETARQIRRVVGPSVTIIIITAYDWRPIEADALDAGVSMFMEKPLFHSSIVKVFEKVYLKKKDTPQPSSDDVFDFTGKRVLLVEDHPLNVEVAKRMLEKVGVEVVVASNGLEAIETFTTEKVGWFDAILMDIRMPVMDGLTAAKNIRSLRKKGSRDIPIIAMTANAFDEDAEMSLSSGMNAHLTKPIEPQVLFATLKRLIKG